MATETVKRLAITLVKPPVRIPRTFVNYPTVANLGLLQNAAVLERRGFKVSVVDALFLAPRLMLRREGGYLVIGDDSKKFREAVTATEPEAVVIGNDMFCDLDGYSGGAIDAVLAAVRRTNPRVTTILADCFIGGIDYFPYDPRRVLRRHRGLDFVLTGENEVSLPALLKGAAPRTVGGCWYRAGDKTKVSSARPSPIRDLDALPPPAYHLLDMDSYFRVMEEAIAEDLVHEFHRRERLLALQTSRGCPFSCSFCASILRGVPYRAHSAGYVNRLVDDLNRRYRVNRFVFLDDAMNIDRTRFSAICTHLARKQVPWHAVNGLRADLLTEAHIRAMKRAGNRKLTVSAESGDQRVCDKIIGKRLDLRAVGRVAGWARRIGLPMQVHYVIGFPGETIREINSTLRFAARLHEDHGARPLLQVATPVPGTPLERACRRHRWLVKEYATADLRGAFTGTGFITTKDFSPALLGRHKNRFETRVGPHAVPMLMLDPGYACNSACTFCCTATFRRRAMSKGAAFGIVADAYEQGVRRIDIGGGEPTLVPWLPDLVARCRELGMTEIGVVTNGRMLSYRSLAARLVKAGLHRVSVTLCGPDAAAHDSVARAQGAFEQAVTGIDNLRAAGLANIHGNLVGCRSTLARLAETVRLMAAHGLGPINIQLAVPMGAALRHGEWLERYEDAVPALEAAAAALPRGSVRIQNVPFCFMPRWTDALEPEASRWDRRITLPGSGEKTFAAVLAALKTRLPYCILCEYDVVCGGVWKRSVGLYAADRWRPKTVTRTSR